MRTRSVIWLWDNIYWGMPIYDNSVTVISFCPIITIRWFIIEAYADGQHPSMYGEAKIVV